jgi:hypothetical protein
MPCALTAHSVKIASPGDSAMELIIAREVICEWNAHHALERKQILLPLCDGGIPASSPADLLVAFFSASQETLDEQAVHETGGEIERHLQAGRPALIYFSGARADFAAASEAQKKGWNDLRKRYESRAAIDSYGDEKEFRAKFSRQIDTTIGSHIHFKDDAPIPVSVTPPVAAAVPPPERELTAFARTLLIEACEDFEAYIGRVKVGNTLKIQANGKQLVEPGKPDLIAIWDAAFEELLTGGYIRDAGCNGQLYQISPKGFDFLKSIGKTPVGYIAELGGM